MGAKVRLFWSAREETRGECAARWKRTIDGLANEPNLGEWYHTAYSKKKAKEKRVDTSLEGLEKALSMNRNEVDRKPILDLGYSLRIWNGDFDREAALSGLCGCYSKFVKNGALLSLPILDEDEFTAETAARLERILRLFVEVWEPDNATAEILHPVGENQSLSREYETVSTPWEPGGLLSYENGQWGYRNRPPGTGASWGEIPRRSFPA